MRIEFTVIGKAAPAGSKTAFAFKKKDGSLGATVTDANPRVKSWKRIVTETARDHYDGPLLDGPLRVTFVFYRQRPKGHFRKNGQLSGTGLEDTHPTMRPDVLKLARGAEDALTGVLWRDDSQIVD
jgi:Holliday junction resolvase RusA-like endonuclease